MVQIGPESVFGPGVSDRAFSLTMTDQEAAFCSVVNEQTNKKRTITLSISKVSVLTDLY